MARYRQTDKSFVCDMLQDVAKALTSLKPAIDILSV